MNRKLSQDIKARSGGRCEAAEGCRRTPVHMHHRQRAGRIDSFSIPEAAFLLNCHPNTITNLISRGQLESFRLGRRRLVARSAIDAFIAKGGVVAS